MSLRNEQCNKVCRILDDVLANRPTERDSLITAVRKAFGALETEPQWIPCSECINYIDERCVVANHHVSEKENCMEVFGAKRRTVQGGS